MQVPLIHVQEVSLAYGEKLALDKVSLSCRPGELVGLLGPNGAGKTTLLEMLEGVNIPQSGRVSVCGSDPRRFGAAHKRDVGFIFQRSALPNHVRVGQLVHLVQSTLDAADDAATLLEALGLDALTRQTIGDLSVGQQQRLSAFVALHGRRSTLVMDEPTAALDIRSKRAIWDCIKRKKEREGTGGLIATHDMTEAMELCDRVYFIDRGQIRGSAGRDELLGRGSELTFLSLRAPASFYASWPSLAEIAPLGEPDAGRREFRVHKTLLPRVLEEVFEAERALGFNAEVMLGARSLEALYVDNIASVN